MDKEKLKQIIEELKTIARDETSIGAGTTSYAVSASNTDSSGETFDPVTGYKRIALPCKMQLAVNFVKNRRYNIFEDFPADNALMGLSIYHIFRSNLDTSKYGMGFALNLYQHIKTVGSKLFYIYGQSIQCILMGIVLTKLRIILRLLALKRNREKLFGVKLK